MGVIAAASVALLLPLGAATQTRWHRLAHAGVVAGARAGYCVERALGAVSGDHAVFGAAVGVVEGLHESIRIDTLPRFIA